MSRRACLASIALAIAIPIDLAAAQPDLVRGLDEEQFLAAVEAHDPRLQRLAAEVEVARADIGVARVRPNPTIALDREEVFPDGGAATNYARLTVPLQISGRRGRRVEAARTAADAATAAADADRFQLVIEALRTYVEAAHARLHLETLRGERDTLVRVVEVVRKRASAGTSSGYDVQRIELELAAYDDLITSGETRLFDLRTQLAALAGAPGELIDASSDLALPVAPALPATDGAALLEPRGDYRAARLRARAAEQRAGAAARGRIPDLGISAGVMSADVGTETAMGYTVGLALAVPLFDRGTADAARARSERRLAEAEARIIEARLPGLVRSRHDTLVRRIAQADALATSQLSRLEALLRSAETGYRDGDGSVVELLDAYQTARDARLRHLELRRDARLAELDLWQALGRRP